jgi:hypothetical protein
VRQTSLPALFVDRCQGNPGLGVGMTYGLLEEELWAAKITRVLTAGPPAGPPSAAAAGSPKTECLLRSRRSDALVRVRVRYLRMQHKQVEKAGPQERYSPVESFQTDDGTVHLTFAEAVPLEQDVVVPLADLMGREHTFPVGASEGEEIEPLPAGAGRVVRRRAAVRATTTILAEQIEEDVCRLRIRTENTRHPNRAPLATRRCARR